MQLFSAFFTYLLSPGVEKTLNKHLDRMFGMFSLFRILLKCAWLFAYVRKRRKVIVFKFNLQP